MTKSIEKTEGSQLDVESYIKLQDEENGEKPANLSKMKRYSENPFMKSAVEYARGKKRTVVKGGKAVVDLESGEYEETAEITTVRTVDAESFVKIYPTYAGRIFSLSKATQKVFAVVLREVSRTALGRDTVLLNEKIIVKHLEEMEEKPPARATIFKCLAELCSKNIIARNELDTNLYYINLNIFFNGNRIKFVDEWHIQYQDKLFKDSSIQDKS